MHGPPKETHRALHAATAFGDTEIVRVLVENGVNVLERVGRGPTPLHSDAQHGRSETLRVLLEMGTNVHSRSEYGETPLHWAATGGHLEAEAANAPATSGPVQEDLLPLPPPKQTPR